MMPALMKIALVFVFCLANGVLADAAAQQADDTDRDVIILFDSSASMLAEADGSPKIDLARGAVDDLLAALPASRQVSLVTFGHGPDEGCGRIETLVPLGNDREQIRSTLAEIEPRGFTPLSAALEQVAEQHARSARPLEVILFSDGGDQCFRDPCALAKKMEAANATFTAHVIAPGSGAEINVPDLKCVADATGGRFLAVGEVTQLASAELTDGVPALLRLVATDPANGQVYEDGLSWRVVRRSDNRVVFESTNAGVTTTEVEPDTYDIFVVVNGEQLTAEERGVSVVSGAERTVYLTISPSTDDGGPAGPVSAPADDVVINLESDEPVYIGSDMSIALDGSRVDGDYVTISRPDDQAQEQYPVTAESRPLEIIAPLEPGDYEIRYFSSSFEQVAARERVTVIDVTAALGGPKQVRVGQQFRVQWKGPGYKNDRIAIAPPKGSQRQALDNALVSEGNPVLLTAPKEPGKYELQYWLRGERVVATSPIEVVAGEDSPAVLRRIDPSRLRQIPPKDEKIEPQ